MTTYPLPLPDSLAARLAALPTEKVHSIHAAALDAIEEEIEGLEAGFGAEFDGWQPTPVRLSDLSPEDADAIREGLAEIDAGQGIPGNIALAELRELAALIAQRRNNMMPGFDADPNHIQTDEKGEMFIRYSAGVGGPVPTIQSHHVMFIPSKFKAVVEQAKVLKNKVYIEALNEVAHTVHLTQISLPPAGFAEAHRLGREARGDMRSAAEIIRQDRDEADERREAVFRGEA